ncbi:MAG: hypothetical protein KF760_00050 [Candidatus Eremiobacteraeota bacterium]|nr:hypothetical protein [Candidatus Eremiobacteraeota bacterium]MCW5866646.1 hypothetical protein [Candidatus Eremiobacteraeota bacterium]
MWWIFWLWLAVPRLPVGPAFYPPDDSILLQNSGQVQLRWTRPGKKFVVRFWQGEVLQSQVTTTERSFPVSVESGGTYLWSVQSTAGGPVENHAFSVAGSFAYHSDGRSGTASDVRGLPGSNGGQLRVELVRDEHGMNLYIVERQASRRYLFCEPGLRFLITARGGNGSDGAAGRDFSSHPQGYDGGAAGWGGNIRVLTRNAPWRDYLDLDVTPGQAGRGGRGGFYQDGDDIVQAPDGAAGRPGQGGRVDTRLEP